MKAKIEKYHRVADLGENASAAFANYGVRKKAEGKYMLSRILMICGYILFGAVYFFTLVAVKILPMIALLPVLTLILVLATWRWVSIEYEYFILDGEFRMLKVYGGKNAREMCRVRVSSMERIAPYFGDHIKELDEVSDNDRIFGVSTMNAPDIYFAVFTEDGKKKAVLFEATQKTLKSLKYYNSQTVVTSTAR